IGDFEFTNLERFYAFEPAREFLGIDFDNENGELKINLPREEFEKRILEVFKIIIDSERFSRDFNKDDDKQKFIENLNRNPIFDFTQEKELETESKTTKKKTDLESEKNKIT